MPEIPYTLIRAKRKSIQLSIKNDGELVVRAPKWAKDSDIQDFVQLKAKWIKTKQQQAAAFDEQFKPVVIAKGEGLLYLGQSYTILLGPILSVQISDNSIIMPEKFTLDHLRKWLKQEAKRVLTERTAMFSQQMSVNYTALKLSSAKTRWGSCSAKNSLNFSWRLIMCPPEVIDYLVVHELTHIIQKNHSPKFWQLVEDVLPDYRQQKKWLKDNRKVMDLI